MAANYAPKHFNITFPQEYVAHVEINRPNQLNAFFEAMWIELGRIFNQLSVDPAVRAIIISGAGEKAFTAGLDVKAASSGLLSDTTSDADPARKAVHLRRNVTSFQDCVSTLEKCEKPVIVVMHGFSLGLAIDLSSAADVRFCAKNTKFAVKEVDIGLAADVGTLSRLPKIVGNFGWVKDVALTARLFGAEEALSVGFVSRVFDSKQEAIVGATELAGLIASKSPIAVQGTKELLNWSRDHTVQDGLRYTTIWNSAALQTKDVSAALLSGIQKRKPTFEKL
ncbi:ClpP/crotonase-like domain-containing protein [Aspergillus karnatakaensis]|uniref:enoyl-CoA hydratase/isomerase family protein n=1 Tax=Aspergillus karnatakaensis TaxID=1810916 RepID=UPI003CCDC3B8